jgi:hypothetical protein
MTVIVTPHTEEQEKALVEFLDRMQYVYQSDSDIIGLTERHKQEILKRDNDFINGKTTARDWNAIKRELRVVYT